MSNKEMLEKLTKGINKTTPIIIEFEDEEYEFTMRPLTAKELMKLQSHEKKGFVIKVNVGANGKKQSVSTTQTDVDVNAGEFNELQSETMMKAIAWSLSIDTQKITLDDLETLPVGVLDILFENVINISNLNDTDLTIIKKFRENR